MIGLNFLYFQKLPLYQAAAPADRPVEGLLLLLLLIVGCAAVGAATHGLYRLLLACATQVCPSGASRRRRDRDPGVDRDGGR